MLLRRQDYGHAIVHAEKQVVRRRGQNCAAFHELLIRPPPAIPQASESKGRAVVHLKAKGLFFFRRSPPLVEGAARTRQRCFRKGSRNEGLVAAVSARALIVRAPTLGSSDQDGISPQRIIAACRTGVFAMCRMTGTDWVGAML